ncbi:hypothetical protein [Massilia yuzhufengensis]|uniref:DUF4345 domain-containing protein n=1 Tax=Massilia yuzhufengensis TaxID=1164594 RepID=A0A1I1ENK2_9BURK|nr:hypothetical protein [Massilia yuzhufengensis]SFB88232.1 hypothetical protein SAMN05216204_102174 [Massilia yuzhufengensis]
MNHRIILRIGAVVGSLYGLILVISPNTLMNLYRAQALQDTGLYFAMLSGAMLLGWAAMNWAASNAPQIAEIHYVLLGNLVTQVLGFLVSLVRQLSDAAVPQSGWLNVAIFLVFTAAFGYLYLASPAGYRLHARSRPA